jgi:3-hydroxyacyl-[acyl-carrier-protein] dehydratase
MSAQKLLAVPLDALDEVASWGDGWIRTVKRVRGDEPYFVGHYPGHPLYPGVFLIEAVLQAARAYLDREGKLSRLVEVVSTRFLAPVQPGDTLEVHCDFTAGETADEVLVKAYCVSGSVKVSNVKVRLQRGDSDAQPL